jgi:hypothetical protein
MSALINGTIVTFSDHLQLNEVVIVLRQFDGHISIPIFLTEYAIRSRERWGEARLDHIPERRSSQSSRIRFIRAA